MSKFNSNHSEFPFLSRLDVDQDVRRRLSINLEGISKGDNEAIITPMGRDYGPDYLIAKWDEVFQAKKDTMNDVLMKIEEAQRGRTGPRSISKPWSERRAGILSSFEQTNLDYSALDATPLAFRGRNVLRPLTPKQAIKFLKNDTNSGLPYYTRKSKVKDRLIERFEALLSRKDPCILFTRTQEQGKTRDVWGFPSADTLNEMRFYRPLLEYQKKQFWRTALSGPDEMNKRITYIIKQAKLYNLEIISVDFSSYDSSIKPGLQSKINLYYKYLFQDKYHNELDYICERKSTIGLLTPDGIMQGPHGEPSGSTFTNEDDSVGQFIVSKKSQALVRDLFEIQGDDGVYAVKKDMVSSLYNNFKRYGFKLNEDKSDRSSDYAIYLQNLYHVDYEKGGVIGGIYPTYRALNRIIYQERWSNFEEYNIKGSDYFAIRAICILENCKFHPLFKELVSFVAKYDKFGLRPTQKGISEYVRMITDTSGTEGILINQYGDNVKGIRNFDTVKIIKRLK